MLVISGSINSSRPGINEIIDKRDTGKLLELANKEMSYGADVIALNCGTRFNSEADDIEWMVRTIMQELEVRMCIDSPNLEAQKAGLAYIKTPRPIIDSITAEKKRMEEFLPLVKRHNAQIVALAMDEVAMPKTAEEKLAVVQKYKEPLKEYDIDYEDVFLDPLLFPIASDTKESQQAIRAIRLFKQTEPSFKVSIGLDNISHGLPQRELLSRTFLTMAAVTGIDAAFIVLDEKSLPLLITIDTLLGNDPFCQNYLRSFRQGLLG